MKRGVRSLGCRYVLMPALAFLIGCGGDSESIEADTSAPGDSAGHVGGDDTAARDTSADTANDVTGSACDRVCAALDALGCGAPGVCASSCVEADAEPVLECIEVASSCGEAALCSGSCLCDESELDCTAGCECDPECASLGACTDETFWGSCDGGTLTRCVSGQVWAQTCSGAATCTVEYPRTDPVDHSGCIVDDASCEPGCEGLTRVSCDAGVARRLDCRLEIGAGAACEETDEGARCYFRGPSNCIDEGTRNPMCLSENILSVCDGQFRPIAIDCRVGGEGVTCGGAGGEACCWDGAACVPVEDGSSLPN